MTETKSQVDEFEKSIRTIAHEYDEVADAFVGSQRGATDAIANLHTNFGSVSTDLLVALSDGGINVIRAYKTYDGGTVLTVTSDTTEEDE